MNEKSIDYISKILQANLNRNKETLLSAIENDYDYVRIKNAITDYQEAYNVFNEFLEHTTDDDY